MQYLLSLKFINPVATAFGSSHEEINRWHRVLGRIIYLFMCIHSVLYLNNYVQVGVLVSKLTTSPTAILGFTALLGSTLLMTTALSAIRRFSHRVFFIAHVLVAFVLPPAIFFHVHHARVYMVEALGVFVVDLIVRKFYTVTAEASVELIPGTNLIKITAKVPESFASDFQDAPGSHAYVNIPAKSRPGLSPVYELTFNPFTVAWASEESQELLLVARQLKGPVSRALSHLAGRGSGARAALKLEGPHGISRHFPALVGGDFDRVLLVAGGIGSTFILPIYQSIVSESPAARVDMIWTVREAAEATWPSSIMEKSALDDERIQLFLTGSAYADVTGQGSSSGVSRDVEMEQMHKDRKRDKYASKLNHKRPDLRKIVDEVFRHGQDERVAVLVCGPEAMARELRGYVGNWVNKGREVWWHNENFSW
jgi:NAD(P)H-flavin reductase